MTFQQTTENDWTDITDLIFIYIEDDAGNIENRIAIALAGVESLSRNL